MIESVVVRVVRRSTRNVVTVTAGLSVWTEAKKEKKIGDVGSDTVQHDCTVLYCAAVWYCGSACCVAMRAKYVSTAATASATAVAVATLLLASGTTHALITPAYNSNPSRVSRPLLYSWSGSQPRQLPNRQQRAVPLTCELERLPRRTLQRVAPQHLTFNRGIAACLGQTSAGDRHGSRIVDSISLILVVWFVSFFASRTLLIAFSTSGSLAWRACGLTVFMRAVWAPLMETHKKSAELWGDRSVRNRTRGALFTGRYPASVLDVVVATFKCRNIALRCTDVSKRHGVGVIC